MVFEEKEEQRLDLFVLLEDILQEAKRLIAMGLILILVFGAGMGFWAKVSYRPRYQASASFTVKVADPTYASVNSYNSKTAEQMAKTFPYILTSGVLSNRVKEALNISSMPTVSVTVMPNANVITLSVQDADPQKAYDVLNAVITYYPEIAEFVVGSTVLSLLDESGVPTSPANALNLKKSCMKGALTGAAIWFVIVLAMALTKTTVHNEDMLRSLLNFDCFGQVPSVKVPSRDSCPLLHKGRKKPEFSEAIRALRMRVERAMEPEEKKVLLVSSAIPGEGKTTVSLNLAMSIARRGKRVLVIDCDLRNPSVAKGLKLTSKISLADYLRGKATIRDAICATDTENLFVIPGGSGGAGTTELLTRERGTSLIQAARNLFDFVILDTPPCSMLADAGEVAELADAGLLVVRQNFASRDQILDGVQRLGDADLPLIGWVLNNTARTLSYGYGYGYGDGYGYGYGYGSSYGYGKKSK